MRLRFAQREAQIVHILHGLSKESKTFSDGVVGTLYSLEDGQTAAGSLVSSGHCLRASWLFLSLLGNASPTTLTTVLPVGALVSGAWPAANPARQGRGYLVGGGGICRRIMAGRRHSNQHTDTCSGERLRRPLKKVLLDGIEPPDG